MYHIITKYLQIQSQMDQVHAALQARKVTPTMRAQLQSAVKHMALLIGDMEIEMTDEEIAKPEWQKVRTGMMEVLEIIRTRRQSWN